MTIGARPMCSDCRHFRWPDMDAPDDGKPPSCDAFPDGIPDAIYDEGFDHTKPYEGDSGIQFEPLT